MIEEINGFTRWTKEPNTICEGALVYFKEVYFDTKNKFVNRKIRVYIPSTYDFNNPNKRFPVLYMADGKNLFDDYTSFVGEWKIDEITEAYIKDGKIEGMIVVGIDAPNTFDDRADEMTAPEWEIANCYKTKKDIGYADTFADFIFKTIKPMIDKTFFTYEDKEHTAFGGSSMGGLMASYVATHYSEFVSVSLLYSPAYFLLSPESFKKYKDERMVNNGVRLFFYVGDVSFEHKFVKRTIEAYNHYKKLGYKDNKDIVFYFDKDKEHNEKAWSEYFPEALDFLFEL